MRDFACVTQASECALASIWGVCWFCSICAIDYGSGLVFQWILHLAVTDLDSRSGGSLCGELLVLCTLPETDSVMPLEILRNISWQGACGTIVGTWFSPTRKALITFAAPFPHAQIAIYCTRTGHFITLCVMTSSIQCLQNSGFCAFINFWLDPLFNLRKRASKAFEVSIWAFKVWILAIKVRIWPDLTAVLSDCRLKGSD